MDNERALTVIGEELIEKLQLKLKENGRVDTSIGDKTPLGLAKTVERVFVNGNEMTEESPQVGITNVEKLREEIFKEMDDHRRAFSEYGAIEQMQEQIEYLERIVAHTLAYFAEHLRLSTQKTHDANGLLDW